MRRSEAPTLIIQNAAPLPCGTAATAAAAAAAGTTIAPTFGFTKSVAPHFLAASNLSGLVSTAGCDGKWEKGER